MRGDTLRHTRTAGNPAYKRFAKGETLKSTEFTLGDLSKMKGSRTAKLGGKYAAVLDDRIIELKGEK